MPIIVDGYNLFHTVKKTAEEFESLLEKQLCLILSAYLERINDYGWIIFDGTGPADKTSFEDLAGLEVFFAGPETDADTIIEEEIIASTAPKRLWVVSNDRRLRSAARKRKAVSVRCETFWKEIMKQLTRTVKTSPEPKQKFHGLTEAETDWWLDFFDRH